MNNQEIPDTLAAFLSDFGLSKGEIKKSNMDTRLYHDLGIYGDTAWWFVEELAKKVDMSHFYYERYFPPEFSGEGFLQRAFFSMVPFASFIRRRRESFTSITIRMVAESLEKGEWIDPFITETNSEGPSAPQ